MSAGTVTVTVALGERSYPIHIGSGLLQPQVLRGLLDASGQSMVISNPTVFELFGEQLLTALGQGQVDTYLMPDGEAHKNMASYTAALDELMAKRHNRSTCVYALGGGVVGDLSGFVAATYQRGVDFVQIPTTLLSQVDSSVGGKTAINHPGGKNMIGAFYQPRCVIIDLDVLQHLPEREYKAGLAEVLKYGVIADSAFFAWLEDHVDALNAREADALTHAIKRSVEIKADVVAQDEREGGLRAILNFGHTFGHAIENLSGYGHYLHGEAVAIGMVMAGEFSHRLGMFGADEQARLKSLTEAFGLPSGLGTMDTVAMDTGAGDTVASDTGQTELTSDSMLSAMGMDKKVVDGRLRLILATKLGQVEIVQDYSQALLRELLTEMVASSTNG